MIMHSEVWETDTVFYMIQSELFAALDIWHSKLWPYKDWTRQDEWQIHQYQASVEASFDMVYLQFDMSGTVFIQFHLPVVLQSGLKT